MDVVFPETVPSREYRTLILPAKTVLKKICFFWLAVFTLYKENYKFLNFSDMFFLFFFFFLVTPISFPFSLSVT